MKISEPSTVWHKYVLVMIFAIFLGSVFAIAHAADDAPAAQTEAQVPGDIQIARWDLLLNDNGLESMDSTENQIVHTPSKIYQAAIFNADALRAAMNAAAAVNGLEAASQSVAYSQLYNENMYNVQPLYFNYNFGPTAHIGIQGNGNGQESYEKTDDAHLHVQFDYKSLNLRLISYDPAKGMTQVPQDKTASLTFDGQLSPGDALAFSATVKDKAGTAYRHVVVWEAFKAEPRYQQNFQMVRDTARWCQLGPKWIRHYTDVATVWSSTAKHPASTVPAKWEQKLEDGKVLRLTGITRSDKYMYCWWDGDGQPVANNGMWFSFQSYYKDQPVWFSAEVTGSSDEWKLQAPSGHPPANQGERSGPFNESTVTVADAAGQAVIGVAVGPWEQIGEIKKGGTIKVGAATYTLRNLQDIGNNQIWASLTPQRGFQTGGDLVMLSAVAQDGTEFDTRYTQMIRPKNYGQPSAQFEGLSLKTLKTFHVWKRKQQWVTFTGFATEPATPPKDPVTAAEVAAAVTAMPNQPQQVQSVRANAQSMKEIRKTWDAIPADPTTPKGALRALFQSASNGDVKSVRARMKATQPNADPTLDIYARLLTASQTARKTAIARYGEDKVQALQAVGASGMAPPPLMDFELLMASATWEPSPDGGLRADELVISKGDDGTYFLDLTKVVEQSSGVQGTVMTLMMTSIANRLEHINQLMKDNPAFTVDQLKNALTDVALSTTQPATKPAG